MKLHQYMSEFLSMDAIARSLREKDYSCKISGEFMRVIDNRGATLLFGMRELAGQPEPVEYVVDKLRKGKVVNITKEGIEEVEGHKYKSVATSLECIGYKVGLDDEKNEMYVQVISDSGRALGRIFSYEQLDHTHDGDIAGFVELAMLEAEAHESKQFPLFLQDVGQVLMDKGYDVAVTRDGNRIQVTKKLNDGATIIRQFTKTEVLDYINPPANIIDAVMGQAIEDHIEYGGND